MSLPFGLGTGGGEAQSARGWTRWLLAQPSGRWLATAIGLAIIGADLGMGHKAWSGSFARHLACDRATATCVIPLGRLGHAARAVVFLVIGGFLMRAAYEVDPSEAHGLGGALAASTLAAFGTFEFAKALCRCIDTPDERGVLGAARARMA
ncbi:DUF1206 domain-containing protein [Dankookia sp. P2]|uniref:DUF1206 domain-containing protein n=1 Tax=Dankookia sp. P2 TaxID=3423955 RepID=UPI003D67A7E5